MRTPGAPSPSEWQPPSQFAYLSSVQPLIIISELLYESPESLATEAINITPAGHETIRSARQEGRGSLPVILFLPVDFLGEGGLFLFAKMRQPK